MAIWTIIDQIDRHRSLDKNNNIFDVFFRHVEENTNIRMTIYSDLTKAEFGIDDTNSKD